MIKPKINTILNEISQVLDNINDFEVELLLNEILKAKNIVVCGAGRVGMAARGFSMRLGHLGLKSFTIGDSNVPALKKRDLLIVCSGSGETQTIYDLLLRAKENGAKIVLVSSYIDHYKSRMAKVSNVVVVINAPTKIKQINGFASSQPMTTLNEQCLQIFFDAIVLILMERLKVNEREMWEKHSNLE